MSGDRARKLAIIYPFIFCICLFLGCNKAKRSQEETMREIKAVMSIREKAMQKKDINLYMGCISKEYRDNTETYEIIRQKMLQNFRVFEKIEFSHSNQTVYINRDLATVVQDYELGFTIAGDRDHARGKEKIFLKKEEGKWKILKGL